MGKEITLTLLEGLKKAQVCADSIFYIKPVGDNSFITTKDGKSLFVKESKSRILKMIETAKQGGFLLRTRNRNDNGRYSE